MNDENVLSTYRVAAGCTILALKKVIHKPAPAGGSIIVFKTPIKFILNQSDTINSIHCDNIYSIHFESLYTFMVSKDFKSLYGIKGIQLILNFFDTIYSIDFESL